MKKGFTLVELMAVILVLGLVLSIIGVSVFKNIKENRQKMLDLQKNMVVNATKKYITESSTDLLPDVNNYSFITINELVRSGNIKSDNYDKENNEYFVVNPVNDQKLEGGVCITYNADYNQYEYNFVVNEETCESLND